MNSLYQFQQNFCPKVEYFMRADEDTVLDVSRFQYWLKKEFNKISKKYDDTVIFGYLYPKNIVLRDPNDRWYVPYETYPNSYYPDYVQGPCYLLPSKAVKAILEEAKKHLHITVDDAFYTGIITNAAGIKVFNGRKYFALKNPLNELNPENQWDRECDENGVPLLFSIVDEDGEIENLSGGYMEGLKKLKGLKDSCQNSNKFY
uniref:Hexosyltransferase n=1 Tax=Panagrolaimus davidi TaxID=227884 RepID=A0A914PD57_9BILA